MASFRDAIYTVLNLNDKTEPEQITRTKIGQKNALDTSILGPKSAFGELHVTESSPSIHIDALQGVLPVIHQALESGTGASTAVKDDHGGREFHCQSGTDVGGYAILRSKRNLRYRPGHGCRIRFTARYGTPVALSAQRAGAINIGTELSFGYEGTQFGILYRTGGRTEIQTLTISSSASGNETATITLDGTPYNVSITSGTAEHNAFEIANSPSFGIGQAWTAQQNETTVIFVSNTVGAKSGGMTFTSTGTAVGTLAQAGEGREVNDTFVNQEDWNINPLTSSNNGGFVLDPSKGNIFEIIFQYLGYGVITYRVADPETGAFIDVHKIKYPNSNTNPNLDSPIFQIGWLAASLGTTTNTEIFGASAYGSSDGKIISLKAPSGQANTKTGVGTTATNIVSIRVKNTFKGYLNLNEIMPKFASFASEGTKTVIAEVYINPTLGGEPNWIDHDPDNSYVEYDTAATTVTGGSEYATLGLGKTDSQQLDLSALEVRLQRNDVLTIAARASSGTTEVSGSITWLEE